MEILATVLQKGGVGKTTTAYHLIRAALRDDKRVLAVDMDPQGNLTTHEDSPAALPRDPDAVLSLANMPELDVILADEVVGTPLDFGRIHRIQAENSDGLAWVWGDIRICEAVLDGRNPAKVHAFLARKMPDIGSEWLEETQEGDLLVCVRVWVETPDHHPQLTVGAVLDELNLRAAEVAAYLATDEGRAAARDC